MQSTTDDKVLTALKNVRLSKVDLPKFDGNVAEWLNFRDIFGRAVHEHKSLSKIDKFTYLKSSLLGKAVETISGLSITSANYDNAWQLLEKQFGDKQRLIPNFMDLLVKLPTVAEGKDLGCFGILWDKLRLSSRSLNFVSGSKYFWVSFKSNSVREVTGGHKVTGNKIHFV